MVDGADLGVTTAVNGPLGRAGEGGSRSPKDADGWVQVWKAPSASALVLIESGVVVAGDVRAVS